jgi:hypothetical protein
MTSMHLARATAPPAAAGSASRIVVAGIDTHKDLHVAAVIDLAENVLGTHSLSTTRAGHRALIRWVRGFGDVRKVGVEGTGSYGAGISRHLCDAGMEVLEVDRPDRWDRRRKGKDDDLDAISAARAALHGRHTSTPKSNDGAVEALRVLRVTRTMAVLLRGQDVGPGRAGGPCRGRRWRYDRLSLAFCAWAASSWAAGPTGPRSRDLRQWCRGPPTVACTWRKGWMT